jgi:agmatinase
MERWTISPEIELTLDGDGGRATIRRSRTTLELSPSQARVLRGEPEPAGAAERVAHAVAVSTLRRLGLLLAPAADGGRDPFLVPEVPMFGAAPLAARTDRPTRRFVGLPWDFGEDLAGASVGPAVLRRASLPLSLDTYQDGWYSYRRRQEFAPVRFVDLGDLNCPLITDYDGITAALVRGRAQILGNGATDLPIFLGGEHGLTYAILTALPEPPAALIVFDAHDDFETGGAMNHGNWLRRIVDEQGVPAVVVLGLRGIAPRTRGVELERAGVRTVTAREWHERASAVEAQLDDLPDGPVYVSIDVDVLDPALAPGTRCPRTGGVRPDMLEDAIGAIAARRRICGIDLMEICRPRYDHDLTPLIASELLFFAAHAATR